MQAQTKLDESCSLLKPTEIGDMHVDGKNCEKSNGSLKKSQDESFTFIFQSLSKKLQSKLLKCKDKSNENFSHYFDDIVSDFQKLQKLLSDNTMFLPSYDIKVAQHGLKVLQEDIQKVQSDLMPAKKFSFRSRAKLSGSNKQSELQVEKKQSSCFTQEPCTATVRDLSGAVINKFQEDIHKKDISLSCLHNCKVCLYGSCCTLLISDLTDCQIFSGPVSSSVYVENCKNCTFVIACQQLRVHNTTSCIFYLHISSRTIIEDSSDLQFAPYNWKYDGQDSDFIAAGFKKTENRWGSIDDFNWLVSGCPSPNWSYLPKEKYMAWG